MDLTNIFLELSEIFDMPFEESLLKRIKNDDYYVIDFIKETENWNIDIRKVKSKHKDIPKRIRLFDQPSASKIGVSFSINSFIGKDRIKKMLKYVEKLDINIDGLSEDIESGKCAYPNDMEEAKLQWGNVIKVFLGYGTVSINGKYVVDHNNYDSRVIEDLYRDMKIGISEDDYCYLCCHDGELIHGGLKEPAWKFLSTTRTTNLPSDKKTFIRCMDCEKKLMKGINAVQSLAKYESVKTYMFERLVIPLTKDKRVWEQLYRLREEYDSDLEYYQAIERLYERFHRRGLNQFLYIRIIRNKRSYAVLDTTVINLDDILRLKYKGSFEKFCWDNGFYMNGKSISFYPKELLESDSSYKWKMIDRIKKYWLGIEKSNTLWTELERFLNTKEGKFSIYQYWNSFLELGDRKLEDTIFSSKNFALGTLMRIAVNLQEKETNGNKVSSLKRRFSGYPKNVDYVFNEIMKVIDYRSRFLSKNEKIEIEKYLEIYASRDNIGEKSHYYLALYKTA